MLSLLLQIQGNIEKWLPSCFDWGCNMHIKCRKNAFGDDGICKYTLNKDLVLSRWRPKWEDVGVYEWLKVHQISCAETGVLVPLMSL